MQSFGGSDTSSSLAQYHIFTSETLLFSFSVRMRHETIFKDIISLQIAFNQHYKEISLLLLNGC